MSSILWIFVNYENLQRFLTSLNLKLKHFIPNRVPWRAFNSRLSLYLLPFYRENYLWLNLASIIYFCSPNIFSLNNMNSEFTIWHNSKMIELLILSCIIESFTELIKLLSALDHDLLGFGKSLF